MKGADSQTSAEQAAHGNETSIGRFRSDAGLGSEMRDNKKRETAGAYGSKRPTLPVPNQSAAAEHKIHQKQTLYKTP